MPGPDSEEKEAKKQALETDQRAGTAYQRGKDSSHGAESHDRDASSPVYTKVQYGQRNKLGGDCPDGDQFES